MIILHILSVIFSFIFLAAHFLRDANTIAVMICLAAPLFLLIRRPWSARLLQVFLSAGAFVWVLTLVEIALNRVESGESWTRLVLILGSVALFTGFSAMLFDSDLLSKRFGIKSSMNSTVSATDDDSGEN
jgi:hypothetical protein